MLKKKKSKKLACNHRMGEQNLYMVGQNIWPIVVYAAAAIFLRESIAVPNLSAFGTLAIVFADKTKCWQGILFFYLALFISDIYTGLYNTNLMLLVYLSYLGYYFTRNPLAGSVIFFIFSNLAVYFTGNYYTSPIDALVAGIPFYKYTLMGDIIFYLLYKNSLATDESRFQNPGLLQQIVARAVGQKLACNG
jgi:hypothetical protein